MNFNNSRNKNDRTPIRRNAIKLRRPTRDNPFMNIQPTEYNSQPLYNNYNRYRNNDDNHTIVNNEVEQEVHQHFDNRLPQNMDDFMWNRLKSQRQFFSQPVGSIPNNQVEFANWLYNTDNNCKYNSIFMGQSSEQREKSKCSGNDVTVPSNRGTFNPLMSSVYNESDDYNENYEYGEEYRYDV